MAQRKTRTKIKWQWVSVDIDLKKTQAHMVNMAAIADDRSGYINENLPVFIASIEEMIKAWDRFREGL